MSSISLTTLAVGLAGFLAVLALLAWYVRQEPDRILRRIIVLGFVTKLTGTAVYYRVIADVYGSGDVTAYVRVGRELAPLIRSGTLPDEARETGTRFMEFLAGVVFAVFGSSEIVAYLVFSMLSFIGMLAFLKALQLAAPGLDHRRYAVLLLLLPTMLFWPSTIGKDAWLVFTLGMASYGGARILRRARFGYVLAALAVAGMGAVRPHMAALFAVSFAAAYLLRLRDPDIKRGALGWLVGLALIGGGVIVATTNFSDEMGRSDSEEGSTFDRVRADTDEIFERTDRNTRLGGGEFDSRPVSGPVDFLHATITVPFRPFPTEAHNRQAQLISFEGIFLIMLGLASLPRLARLPQTALRTPYVAFAFVYTAGFIMAFANVGNFGILSRQRSQLLPFLLVLLVVARKKRRPILVTSDEVPEPATQSILVPHQQAPPEEGSRRTEQTVDPPGRAKEQT
jgi:hypothetical protein